MLPHSASGALRLFRLFRIDVYLHWTWFILVFIAWRRHGWYSSQVWNLIELVAVFAIIVMHEFGHALACRSVGGRVERIVLWPLGGVAFVQPPARPGALLWSIVAGPLVNVLLIPVLVGVAVAANTAFRLDPGKHASDLETLLGLIAFFNTLILCFNLLPIYPLDGGQILQALLWFFMPRSLSLRIVAVMGVLAAVAGGVAALWYRRDWYVILAVFIGWQSIQGYRVARLLAAQEQWERGPEPPI